MLKITLSLLSAVSLISQSQCFDRKEWIPDPYLDVVFMLDQSGSMGYVMYKDAYKDMIDWIESYLDRTGAEFSQFAAIFCCQEPDRGGVQHYFDQKNYATTLRTVFSSPKLEYYQLCWDNWNGCLDMAADQVFKEERGHRKNATSIAIYISDCALHMARGTMKNLYNESAYRFIEKVHGSKFVFLCVLEKVNDTLQYALSGSQGQTYKHNIEWMLSLNNQSEDGIIMHIPNTSIANKVDKIVPLKLIEIFDCKMHNVCTAQCFRSKGRDQCYELCNFTVYQWNSPPRFAHPCQRNEAVNEKIYGCECNADGDFYHKTGKTEIVQTHMWIIIVSVVGGLFLIVIILAVVFFTIRSRRQKRKRENRGVQSKGGSEDHKGVGVDIQMAQGTSGGKGQSSKGAGQSSKTGGQSSKRGGQSSNRGGQSKAGEDSMKGVDVAIPKPRSSKKSGSKATSVEKSGKNKSKNPISGK